MATTIPFIVRGNTGIQLWNGPPNISQVVNATDELTSDCKNIIFSPNGEVLTHVSSNTIKILESNDWTCTTKIDNIRVSHLAFSPQSTYLAVWEQFYVSKEHPDGKPNLHIFRTADGSLLKNFIHKRQNSWQPQWTKDEHLVVRLVNHDLLCYEKNLERTTSKITKLKIESFSVSSAVGQYFILAHILNAPGQPSFARLWNYNGGAPLTEETSLKCRSILHSDKVTYYWDFQGTNCLILASTEVDKTGSSYYGKQLLCLMDIYKSHSSLLVNLGKEGPIYSVTWSPISPEFCVVYGFMPASATMFNSKCEIVYDFGTGPRNCVYYNIYGNLLLFGGFGNIQSGTIAVWHLKCNESKTIACEKIGECASPDSTQVEWSPDGMHFMTATTSPRLRIGNCFKLWHYTGAMLFEHFAESNQEWYQVIWKPFLKNAMAVPIISQEKVSGTVSVQPVASKQVYRPPYARNPGSATGTKYIPGLYVDKSGSQGTAKNKKNKNSKKNQNSTTTSSSNTASLAQGVSTTSTTSVPVDPIKRAVNIKKKLESIVKLKQQQQEGKVLLPNQLTKIATENSLLEELKDLAIDEIKT